MLLFSVVENSNKYIGNFSQPHDSSGYTFSEITISDFGTELTQTTIYQEPGKKNKEMEEEISDFISVIKVL